MKSKIHTPLHSQISPPPVHGWVWAPKLCTFYEIWEYKRPAMERICYLISTKFSGLMDSFVFV